MIRVAVLGAGAHSSGNHGPALHRCQQEEPDRVELAAVCDLDEGRAHAFAERFGFRRTYVDLDRMVGEERLDGIVAITPMESTAEIAARIARVGIPLVVEKPPGEDLAAAERLLHQVRANGTPHMVSFNRRFSPALTRARQWLADRPPPGLALGRLLRHDRRESFFVFGTGIHLIDAILAVMGRPTGVRTEVTTASPGSTRSYAAQVRLASGHVAALGIAPAAGRVEETIELVGADYGIAVDIGRCGVTIHRADRVELAWQADPGAEEWERNGTLDETRAFLGCLAGRRDWWPTLEDGLWSARVAAAVERGGEAAVDG